MLRTLAYSLFVFVAVACPVAGWEGGHAGDDMPQVEARNNFGVDWPRKPQAAIDVQLPAPVVEAFRLWGEIADKIDAAVWWGAFTSGALSMLAACLTVAIVVMGARAK